MSENSSSLIGAVNWLRDLLLGSVGTTVAIIAIGGIGLLLLTGRVPIRRGVTTVIGCFILFSASSIAEGLASGSASFSADSGIAPEPPVYEATNPVPVPYDPYEGAAAPVRPDSGHLR